MNATKQITEILTACGCKPAATVDDNGNAVIKVNAPAITADPIRYYLIKSWANASMITDTLQAKKIPFASYVLSGTQIKIEINAGDLPAASTICDGWKGV
jgi:hypothetical protein